MRRMKGKRNKMKRKRRPIFVDGKFAKRDEPTDRPGDSNPAKKFGSLSHVWNADNKPKGKTDE